MWLHSIRASGPVLTRRVIHRDPNSAGHSKPLEVQAGERVIRMLADGGLGMHADPHHAQMTPFRGSVRETTRSSRPSTGRTPRHAMHGPAGRRDGIGAAFAAAKSPFHPQVLS